MKQLIKKYRPVLKFVVLFLGTYFLLSLAYGLYLMLSENGSYYPDFLTNLVARQSSYLIGIFGYSSYTIPDAIEPVMRMYLEKIYISKIVEGCNSVSVIIIFIAFIVSFAEKFKKTFLFILLGTILIYVVNLIRIVVISITMYHYPQYQDILHTVIFPSMIYGMVFILWVIWIRRLPKINTSKNG